MPDGTPAPQLFGAPCKLDIVLWLPVMYISWTLGSFVLCIVMLVLNNSQEECDMTGGVVTLFSLVMITLILSIWATVWMCMEACQRQRVSSLDIFRVVLYRIVLITRTTQQKKIFLLITVVDIISILTALIGIPIFITMAEECDFSITSFTIMLDIYQLFAIFRMILFLGHFLYGKRFWRWVKRQSGVNSCLNMCEYEERVEFEIFNAKDYVNKVNHAVLERRNSVQ